MPSGEVLLDINTFGEIILIHDKGNLVLPNEIAETIHSYVEQQYAKEFLKSIFAGDKMLSDAEFTQILIAEFLDRKDEFIEINKKYLLENALTSLSLEFSESTFEAAERYSPE